MAAHQHDWSVLQRVREGGAQATVANQKVAAVAREIADFEDRRTSPEESAHVAYRSQSDAAHHPEQDHGGGVRMNDGGDVGPGAIDFAVNEAFEIDRAPIRPHDRAVESNSRMSAACTRAGAMLRESQKRSGRSGQRALT